MKSISFIISFAFLSLFFACQKDEIPDQTAQQEENDSSLKCASTSSGELKIAIISDLHVMAPSLLVNNGAAFQEYLAKDPKLLEYSDKILQAAVSKIIAQKPDLVLIPGDLTKDGEAISHLLVSATLSKFLIRGIQVRITVGNHDVNNPEAVKFDGANTYPVKSVQANKIPYIYPLFGFINSLYKDPYSLSYVSEPIKGLWIIAIDANEYYKNQTQSTVGGIIKPQTLNWLKQRLAEANKKGKIVIGMMHHGLIEHYTGQKTIDPDYVIDDWENTANTLMDAGLKIIFTGHYHANDITKRLNGNKFLYDVETGSTTAYPCTYRMLTIKGSKYSFAPQNILNLLGPDADSNAKEFLSVHLEGYFKYLLINVYGVPDPYASLIAPAFRDATMAHFAGDETPPASLPETLQLLHNLGADQLGMVLGSLWTDINTPDNNVTLNLQDGTFAVE